jgi:hypothetical protein
MLFTHSPGAKFHLNVLGLAFNMLVNSTGPNILITRIMLNNVWGRTGSLTFCTSGSGGPSDTGEKVTYDVVLLIFVPVTLANI